MRVHEPKQCKHCGILFIPKRADQLFCIRQHRIDFNNDKRREKNAPLKLLNTIYLKNEAILQKMYESLKYMKCKLEVSKWLLTYEKFNFQNYVEQSINEVTKRLVYWQFKFGIEPLSSNGTEEVFQIHKR